MHLAPLPAGIRTHASCHPPLPLTSLAHSALPSYPPSPMLRPPAFYKEAPWFVKMALLLLWERSRGRASPVWGYIEQLPSSIDTPVRWSEAELEELQYAPAIKEVGFVLLAAGLLLLVVDG